MATYAFLKTIGTALVDNVAVGKGKIVDVNAMVGERYELLDLNTGRAPAKLKIKHVGHDVVFEVDGQPEVVLRDYFKANSYILDEATGQMTAATEQMTAATGQVEVTTDAGLFALDAASDPVALEGADSVLYDDGQHFGTLIDHIRSNSLSNVAVVSATSAVTDVAVALVSVAAVAVGAELAASHSGDSRTDSASSTPGVVSLPVETREPNLQSAGGAPAVSNVPSAPASPAIPNSPSIPLTSTPPSRVNPPVVPSSGGNPQRDNAAPPKPSVALAKDSSNGLNVTSDGTLNIGDIVPDAKVQYSLDSGKTWVAVTDATIASAAIGNDGDKIVLVRQIDPTAKVSENQRFSFTLDTHAPAVLSISLANDTGNDAADHITNDGTVKITGLENRAKWEYSLDGGKTWFAGTGDTIPAVMLGADGAKNVQVHQTDIAGNVSSDASLNFTLDTHAPSAPILNQDATTHSIKVSDLDDVATWEYSLDGTNWFVGTRNVIPLAELGTDDSKPLLVRQIDLAGNSSEISSLNFTLDANLPVAPVVRLINDTGKSNGDAITHDGTLSITGLDPAGAWQYSIDHGETWLTGTGAVIPTSVFVTDGEKTVLVRQTSNGNNSPTTELSFTLDTTAPNVPSLSLEEDTGGSTTDGRTVNPIVNVGELEPGASWQYQVDGGDWVSGVGATFELQSGEHSYAVSQTDIAGNTSQVSMAVSYTLVTAPTQVTLLTISDDNASRSSFTGKLVAGQSTDDTTPTFGGTLSAALSIGQVVALYDGTTRLGTATVNGTAWTCESTSFSLGMHRISARVENADGTPGAITSLSFNELGDTPFKSFSMRDPVSDTAIPDGGSTNHATPSFSGKLSVPLSAGETLVLFDGGKQLGTAIISGTDWHYDVSSDAPLSTGDHSISARILRMNKTVIAVTDNLSVSIAGEVPAPSALRYDANDDAGSSKRPTAAQTEYVADNAPQQIAVNDPLATKKLVGNRAVSIRSVEDDEGLWTGKLLTGQTTDDGTLKIFGVAGAALAATERVAIYDDRELLGYATVSADNLSWTYTTNGLGTGQHKLKACIQDTMTGEKGVFSSVFVVNENNARITGALDMIDVVKGQKLSGATIGDHQPTLFGTLGSTLAEGEQVGVYDGSMRLGTATINGQGWSFVLTLALADGMHNFTAKIELLDHTALTSSGDFSLTLLTPSAQLPTQSGALDDSGEWKGKLLSRQSMPSQTVSFSGVNDQSGALQGVIANGDNIDDGEAEMFGTLGAALQDKQTVHVFDGDSDLGVANVNGTNWTFIPNMALALSSHSLSAKIIDNGEHVVSSSDSFVEKVVTRNADVLVVADEVRTLTILGDSDHTLDMTQLVTTSVDHVVLAKGQSKITCSLNNVLQGGADKFSSENGWFGLVSGGRHQLLIDGGSNDTIKLDTTAEAANWTNAGQVSHAGHIYDVYNNSNGQAQIVIDHLIQRANGGGI